MHVHDIEWASEKEQYKKILLDENYKRNLFYNMRVKAQDSIIEINNNIETISQNNYREQQTKRRQPCTQKQQHYEELKPKEACFKITNAKMDHAHITKERATAR